MIESGSTPTTFKLSVDHSEYSSGLQVAAKSTGDFSNSLQEASTGVSSLTTGLGTVNESAQGLLSTFSNLDNIALTKANSPFNKLAMEASTAGEAADELAAATDKLWVKLALGKTTEDVNKLEGSLGDFYDKASKVVGKDSLVEKFEEFVQQFKPQKVISGINSGITMLTKNMKGINPELDAILEKVESFQKVLSKAELGLNVITTLENVEDQLQAVAEGVTNVASTTAGVVTGAASVTKSITDTTNAMMEAQIVATGLSFTTTGAVKGVSAAIRDLPLLEITALISGLVSVKEQMTDLIRVQEDFYKGMETMEFSGADTSLIDLSLSMGVFGEKLLFNIDATKQFVAISTQLWQQLEAGIMQIRTLSAAASTSVNEWSSAIQETVNGELQNAVKSTDIIGNIYQAVSAGAKTVELALQQVSVAAKVANATGSNLETVQQALVFTANATNQSLDKVGDIAAKLKVTVDEAILSMEELGNIASSNLASITSLGFKFEETLADIARASQTLGYDSGIAVQRLAQTLSSLTPESEKVAKEYGLNIGRMIKDGESLTDIMHKINSAVGGNINVVREIIPETIAFKGAVALLNTSLEAHEATLTNIKAANEQEVDKLFEDSQSTIQARAEAISNGMREFFTEAGKSFTESGMFEAGIAALEKFLKMLQDAPPWLKNIIGSVVVMNMALSKLSQMLMGIVGIMGTLAATVIMFRLPAIIGGIKNAVLNLHTLGESATFAQKGMFILNQAFQRLLGIETKFLPAAQELNKEWIVNKTINESLITTTKGRVATEWAKIKALWAGTAAETANAEAVNANTTAQVANNVADSQSVVIDGSAAAATTANTTAITAETTAINANTAAQMTNNAVAKQGVAADVTQQATGIKRIFSDVFTNMQQFMGRLMETGKSLFTILGAGFSKLVSLAAPFIATLGTILVAGVALVAIGTILYDIGKAMDLTGAKARKLAEDIESVSIATAAANSKIKDLENKTGESLVRHQTAFGSVIVGSIEKLAEFNNWFMTLIGNIPIVGKLIKGVYTIFQQSVGAIAKAIKGVIGLLESVLGKIPLIGESLRYSMKIMDVFITGFSGSMDKVRMLFQDITLGLNYMANGEIVEKQIKSIGDEALKSLGHSVKLRQELQKGNVATEQALQTQKDMVAALRKEQQELAETGKDPKRLEEVTSALEDQLKLTEDLEGKAKKIEAIEQKKIDLAKQNLSLSAEDIALKKQLTLEILQQQILAQKAQAQAYIDQANATKDPQVAAAARMNAKMILDETALLEQQVTIMTEKIETQELFFKGLREGGRSSTDAINSSVKALDESIAKANESIGDLSTNEKGALETNLEALGKGKEILDGLGASVADVDTQLGHLGQRDFNSAVSSFQELNQAILDLNSKKDKDGNIIPFEPDEFRAKVMTTLDSIPGLLESGRTDFARSTLEFIEDTQIDVVDATGQVIRKSIMDTLTPEQMAAVFESLNSLIDTEITKVKEKNGLLLEEVATASELGQGDKLGNLEKTQQLNKEIRDAEEKGSAERLEMMRRYYGEDHELFKKALQTHNLLVNKNKAATMQDAKDKLTAQFEEFSRIQEQTQIEIEKAMYEGNSNIEEFEKTALKSAEEVAKEKVKILEEELKMYEEGSEKYNEILAELGKAQIEVMKAQIEIQVDLLTRAMKKIEVNQARMDNIYQAAERANNLIGKQLDLQNKARETALSMDKLQLDYRIKMIDYNLKQTKDIEKQAELELEKVIVQEEMRKKEIDSAIEAQNMALKRADLELAMGKNSLNLQKLTLENQIKSLEIEIEIAKVKKTVGKDEITLMNLKLAGLRDELGYLDEEAELLTQNNELDKQAIQTELQRLEIEKGFAELDGQLAIKEAANNVLIAQQEKLLKIKQMETTVMERNQKEVEGILKVYEQSLQRQTEIINSRQQLAESYMNSIRTASKLLIDLSASEGVKARRAREARDRELQFLKIKQEMELEVFKMQEQQQQMTLKRQEIEAKIAVNRAKMEAMSAEIESRKVLMSQTATHEEKQMALLQAEMAKSNIASQEQNLALITEQAEQYEKMKNFRELMFKNNQKIEEFETRASNLDPNGDFTARRQLRGELDAFLEANEQNFDNLKEKFEEFGLSNSTLTDITSPMEKIDNILTQDISSVLDRIDQTIKSSTDTFTASLNGIIQELTRKNAVNATQNNQTINMEVNSPVTVDASGSRENIIAEARNTISRDINNTFNEVSRRIVGRM